MRVKCTTAAVVRGQRIPVALLSFAGVVLVFISTISWFTFAETRDFDPATADVRFGVLGLFHPRRLQVSAPNGSALIVHSGEQNLVLEKSSGIDSASIRMGEGGSVVLTAGERVMQASALTLTGRTNEPVDFILSVPQKITRRYHGTLEIKPSAGGLIAIVAMDRETAVASIVAAESAPDTPLEALKAQAVATRSYIIASRRRHHEFDFCDTTHCQFLREPPLPGSAPAKAVVATRGMVLAYASQPFAAMYTRSCSGRTRTPAALGLPPGAYPYYSVPCEYCRAHPARWTSRISANDAAVLRRRSESARLDIDRRLGWAAVPSNDFSMEEQSGEVVLQGAGEGHGIGLCQSGAKAMAEEGAGFREILNHYYPNSTIANYTRPNSITSRRP